MLKLGGNYYILGYNYSPPLLWPRMFKDIGSVKGVNIL